MITSISSSVGSNTPSLRPDQQTPQRLGEGPRRAPAPERVSEPASPSGGIPAGDSGLGTEAMRRLIASERDPSAEGSDGDLTDAEKDVIEKLRARDVEVRRHEEAHARVGGQYAGQPSYSYQTGPDGKRYAIGGEVPIDVAPIPDDPEATIEKMRVVKAAALAPAEPSGADRRIAALADAQRLQAQSDLATEQREEALAVFEDQNAEGAIGSVDASDDPAVPFAGGQDDVRADRLRAGVRAVSPDSQTDALDRAA